MDLFAQPKDDKSQLQELYDRSTDDGNQVDLDDESDDEKRVTLPKKVPRKSNWKSDNIERGPQYLGTAHDTYLSVGKRDQFKAELSHNGIVGYNECWVMTRYKMVTEVPMLSDGTMIPEEEQEYWEISTTAIDGVTKFVLVASLIDFSSRRMRPVLIEKEMLKDPHVAPKYIHQWHRKSVNEEALEKGFEVKKPINAAKIDTSEKSGATSASSNTSQNSSAATESTLEIVKVETFCFFVVDECKKINARYFLQAMVGEADVACELVEAQYLLENSTDLTDVVPNSWQFFTVRSMFILFFLLLSYLKSI
jgi:hypothetical protein